MIGAFLVWFSIVGTAHGIDYNERAITREHRYSQECAMGYDASCDQWAAAADARREDEELRRIGEEMKRVSAGF